ncbi:hypothetical protein IQ266_23540 [filamentous cyanobacterium LEGE 11480]|uniref:Uncharacterized protein n=1 Tax=Romeriopsis navalis LEGE 11480 TaxID=2777977 RepID=A0A928VQM3_9CYAN|nr:hypothetical protein [Romeriopsis navalis LEGE 11480]
MQGIASEFLLDLWPDRFTADQPTWQNNQWFVPVILAYPVIGAIGQAGEILINDASGKVISHTPLATMQQNGLDLYSDRKDDIEAAFS